MCPPCKLQAEVYEAVKDIFHLNFEGEDFDESEEEETLSSYSDCSISDLIDTNDEDGVENEVENENNATFERLHSLVEYLEDPDVLNEAIQVVLELNPNRLEPYQREIFYIFLQNANSNI